MTKSINGKAQSAFRKLGAVALITAATLALAGLSTSCKQTPTPTPKHEVAFGVEGGQSQGGQSGQGTAGGTLKAKAEGLPETEASPITIEQGKVITFKAEAKAGYSVKGWTLDGKPITEVGTSTEYKLKVSKPATVKVSFEAIPPTKYTVTLTQTEGGKVTASPEIPEDKQVAEDTEITFTATANEGYKIGKWTVTPAEALQAGGADESLTAKVKITADTTVSVSFIKKTYAITFSVEGTGGTLEAKVDGKEISSGDMVEHGKKVEFTPKEEKGYRVKKWTLDGENIGGTAYFTLGVSKPATVTVSFELRPVKGGAVFILSPNNLNIRVVAKTADGSDITVEGCTETTLASNTQTRLHATGTKVILKGNITELECGNNQLTSLNVQGLTSLQVLYCGGNQLTALNVQGLTALRQLFCADNELTTLNVQGLTKLWGLYCRYNKLTTLNVQGCTSLKKLECYCNELNAQAMTKLLNALPARQVSDKARAVLYNEYKYEPEGNCKDFTQPAELKKALEDAKKRKWTLQKRNASATGEEDL